VVATPMPGGVNARHSYDIEYLASEQRLAYSPARYPNLLERWLSMESGQSFMR